MGLIYHYTRFETFMSYIWPSGSIRTNSLRQMNDPRESLPWNFGSINLPYEEIFKGYYSDKTHIDCQYKFGDMIKDKYQVLCFSGANEEGWNNEMMWAHYGGLHSGVCLEFDEELLLKGLKQKYPDLNFVIENVNYQNNKSTPWIKWEPVQSLEDNMERTLQYLVKDVTLSKSKFWDREDERRLICLNTQDHIYIPIEQALKTVYLGVSFDKSGQNLAKNVYRILDEECKLSVLIYQDNRFERWGMIKDDNGAIISCGFEKLEIEK